MIARVSGLRELAKPLNSAMNQYLRLIGLQKWLTLTWAAFLVETIYCAEWPRVIFRDGATNTIYQPQMESWDFVTLRAISAVSIQKGGAAQPTFGTINFVARTRVDRAQREVFFDKIGITEVKFPSAVAESENYAAPPIHASERSEDRLFGLFGSQINGTR